MASANVELLRGIYESWAQGDFSDASWAHPDIELAQPDGVEPFSVRGIEEMARMWGRFLSTWRDLHAVPEEYRELDEETVLVLITNTGETATTGLELGRLETKSANLFKIRDGKVSRLVLYWDRRSAFEDLGLEP